MIILRKDLRKQADTRNLHIININDSEKALNDANWADKEDFERLNNLPYGDWGCFAYTNNNSTINIYVLEIFCFKKKNVPKNEKWKRENKDEILVLKFLLNNNGDIVSSFEEKFSNYQYSEIKGLIMNNSLNINGLTLNYLSSTDLQSALLEVQENIIVNQKNAKFYQNNRIYNRLQTLGFML